MASEEFHYPKGWEQSGLPKAMLQAIGTYLEDRDRELEAWLVDFARNAVSLTKITEAVWTPAAHAASHAPGGTDEVDGLPGLVWRGAYSGATEYFLRDAVMSGGSAYYCIATSSLGSAPPSANWSLLASKGDPGAAGADADPVIAGLFAHGPKGQKGDPGATGSPGAAADEGLIWTSGPDSDLEARRRLAALEALTPTPEDEGLAWMLNDGDSHARQLADAERIRALAAEAALSAADTAVQDAGDALHWTNVNP